MQVEQQGLQIRADAIPVAVKLPRGCQVPSRFAFQGLIAERPHALARVVEQTALERRKELLGSTVRDQTVNTAKNGHCVHICSWLWTQCPDMLLAMDTMSILGKPHSLSSSYL